MANNIRIKNSQTTTNVPTLPLSGEIAINEQDEKLFYRNGAGAVQSLDLTATGGGATPNTFTLNENIAAGAPVAIRTDGKIEGILEVTGALTANNVAAQGSDSSVSISYSPTQDKYLAAYSRASDGFIVCRAGTRTGQSISWGAEVVVRSETSIGGSYIAYNLLTDTFSIGTGRFTGNSIHIVQIISGTPVLHSTLGGVGGIHGPTGGEGEEVPGAVTTLMIGFSTNSIQGTLVNTSIPTSPIKGGNTSLATTNNSPVSQHGQAMVWDPNNNCFWLVFDKAGFAPVASIPTVKKITVSGNVLTAGAEFTLPFTSRGGTGNNNWSINIEHDVTRDKMVITFAGAGISLGGREVLFGWVMDPADGITPTFSAEQILFDDLNASVSRYRIGTDLFYDTALDKWYLYGADQALSDTFLLPFNINVGQTGFDISTRVSISSGPSTSNGSFNTAYPSSENGAYVFTRGVSAGTFQTQVFTPAASSNIGQLIGAIDQTGLAGESKPVNIKGGVDANQSGLVQFSDYFINTDGTLTTTASLTNSFFGNAINSTTLQLADFEDPGQGDVLKAVANEFTKTQNFAQTTLTDGANISWDASSNQVSTVTLAGNRTLDNPANLKAGAAYTLTIKQDATGTRTLSYGTAFKFPGGIEPTLSTIANSVDIITFISDGISMFGVAHIDFK